MVVPGYDKVLHLTDVSLRKVEEAMHGMLFLPTNPVPPDH